MCHELFRCISVSWLLRNQVAHPLIGSTIVICSFWFPPHISGFACFNYFDIDWNTYIFPHALYMDVDWNTYIFPHALYMDPTSRQGGRYMVASLYPQPMRGKSMKGLIIFDLTFWTLKVIACMHLALKGTYLWWCFFLVDLIILKRFLYDFILSFLYNPHFSNLAGLFVL